MARRVRAGGEAIPKPFPKLFPPRACHVRAFRDDVWDCTEYTGMGWAAAASSSVTLEHLGMIY